MQMEESADDELPIITSIPASLATSSDAKPVHKRSDGRKPTQLRPVKVEFNLLSESDGSCKLAFGDTQVICGIQIHPCDVLKHENYTNAIITVNFTSQSGEAKHRDIEIEFQLVSIFSNVILSNMYARQQIIISCQVLNNDGSLFATTINTIQLALIDAGIKCKTMCSAISIAQIKSIDQQTKVESSEVTSLFDPVLIEEQSVDSCIMTFAFTQSAKIEILHTSSSGRALVDENNYMKSLQIAKKATFHILKFFRESLKTKLNRTNFT